MSNLRDLLGSPFRAISAKMKEREARLDGLRAKGICTRCEIDPSGEGREWCWECEGARAAP